MSSRFSLVATSDGSYTLHDSSIMESMHSASGAYEEAVLKHVHPSGVLSRRTVPLKRHDGPLTVLDIGFGLGYNALALIHALQRSGYGGCLEIHSLESSRDYLPFMGVIRFNDERDGLYSLLRRAYECGSCRSGKLSLSIHFDDARVSIVTLGDLRFDCVFHDPYSPSKNPELWTVEFFRKLYGMMKEDAVLTTYSSALQVRLAMAEAGFFIGKGPSVGKKREGTLASKRLIAATLQEPYISDLAGDPKATPYRDLTFMDAREEILRRRTDAVRMRRHSISSSSSRTDCDD
jgi:tRNA U34 5-methylaminomethyl-2-thiouridine-forming methyltransferase MnmC